MVFQGYFFATSKGRMMRSKDLEVDILDRIARIQQKYPELIRPGLEVHEEYGISRSFRRWSNSEVQNRGVDDQMEKAGARKVKLIMRDQYTDVLVSLERFLRYSQAL